MQRHAIETECQRLIVRLTHFADHHHSEEAAALFADDGVWIRGGKTFRGRDQIIGSFEGADRTVIRHVVSNMMVEVGGPGAARATSYYILFREDDAPAVPQGPLQMRLPFSMGEWHDRFVLKDGQWRFAFREVKRLFQRADT